MHDSLIAYEFFIFFFFALLLFSSFHFVFLFAATVNSHNLDDFICTQSGKGPGNVYSLSQFVYTFYKLPIAQNAQT